VRNAFSFLLLFLACSITCAGQFTIPYVTGAAGAASLPTVVQDYLIGTNGGGLVGRYWYVRLPNPTLANNVLICGINYGSTSATITSIVTDKSDSFSSMISKTDATSGYTTAIWGVAPTAGSQLLTITLSAAEYSYNMHCTEVAYASTTVEKSFFATNVTGPTVATNSQTTTINNDFIWQYVVNGDGGNGLAFANPATSIVVGSGFTLLAPNREFGLAAQYQVQTTAGGITPTMTINQSSHDAFDTLAVALEPSSSGTLPSGMYISMEGVFTVPNGDSSPRTEQIPCSGSANQTLVFLGSTNAAAFDLYSGKTDGTTSWLDSEGNTYHAAVGAYSNSPQIVYVTNGTCTSSNSRTVSVAFTDGGSPDPVHWYVVQGGSTLDTSLGSPACIGASGCTATCTSGVCSTSGNQTSKAASNTVCTNSSSYNTGIQVTPSTATGIIFESGYTGSGPTCGNGGSSSGESADATWFQTEDDSCCGYLDSSSTYNHGNYTSATQFTLQDNWANSAASGASGYLNTAIAIKSK
jgi:hypothetical protein